MDWVLPSNKRRTVMKPGRFFLFSILVFCFCGGLGTYVAAQGSYRAQLRGTVSDASGAVVHNATVTITETGTNISSVAHTDDKGEYFFTGLRPSTYSVKAELKGFRAAERTGVVLAVDQEASLNFTLTPASVSEKVEVSTAAPLLDTESATLGTDVTNEYIKNIPLAGRDFFALTFMAGGVTGGGRIWHWRQLSGGDQFCFQWPAECDGGCADRRGIDQRAGTGGRRYQQRLL